MIRICTSLAQNGYKTTLVGRKMPDSLPLTSRNFQQVRLFCFFSKGALFYVEFNIRLFFWLLFQKMDIICSIDLDTILPCLWVSVIRKKDRVYDAHELFCEMKEIVTRPSRYRIWKKIECYAVPRFRHGYTVCAPIAAEFNKMYGVSYEVIRNVPRPDTSLPEPPSETPYFIYQGAVNEGRSFETLIPAMTQVATPLKIFGTGNFWEQTQSLIQEYGVADMVMLMGKRKPEELREETRCAYAGITLFENNGISNYLSLANRFFDYINAGIPQICVNYPGYREINDQYGVALMINDLSPHTIARALNLLRSDRVLYEQLQHNCLKARLTLNWEEEEKKLIHFYRSVES
ncbi:MAG: glycosyltransferase [Bacteroidetes bacterium]|nr:glycosyltransferase [Bacteroidota bacterium]